MRRSSVPLALIAFVASLWFTSIPAEASVAGFDAQFVGQSAYLQLARGQQGTLSATFRNTGPAAWIKGRETEAHLAACLADKATCDRQQPSLAAWNKKWHSATRYARQTEPNVAQGQTATFTYSVKVPVEAASGWHAFHGAVVLGSSGRPLRLEGYHHQVYVDGVSAPTLRKISSSIGASFGGLSVTITGTGFACAAERPTVRFGKTAATITACSATELTVTVPPAEKRLAPGEESQVEVAVVYHGGRSNSLPFTYVAPLPPPPPPPPPSPPLPPVVDDGRDDGPPAGALYRLRITPRDGLSTGGAEITLRGRRGFQFTCDSGLVVRFGSAPATLAQPCANDRLVVTAPPGIGRVRVTVTNSDGSVGQSNWFRYRPVLESISTAGDTMTINGRGFLCAGRGGRLPRVYFGEGDMRVMVRADTCTTTTLTVTIPPGVGLPMTVRNDHSFAPRSNQLPPPVTPIAP